MNVVEEGASTGWEAGESDLEGYTIWIARGEDGSAQIGRVQVWKSSQVRDSKRISRY